MLYAARSMSLLWRLQGTGVDCFNTGIPSICHTPVPDVVGSRQVRSTSRQQRLCPANCLRTFDVRLTISTCTCTPMVRKRASWRPAGSDSNHRQFSFVVENSVFSAFCIFSLLLLCVCFCAAIWWTRMIRDSVTMVFCTSMGSIGLLILNR